jgi:NADPH:quinone reductase-like Zn-dependent oxidoreductase
MSKVIRFHEYGEPGVLKIEELEVREPTANEVQIEVKAIGLNRAESMFRKNQYVQQAIFPSILGYEASGIVSKVGNMVKNINIGDIVSVIPTEDMSKWGTYAELINTPEKYVVKHPTHLSFEEASASWMKYITAWGALIEQAKLTENDFVIITAASSSVGIASFQVSKKVGATVIATTRTSEKKEELLKAGADYVIVTDEQDLAEEVMKITNNKGARVVFDSIGGPMIEILTECMSVGGILLEYGALSPKVGNFPQFALLGKSLTLKGYLYTEIISNDEILQRAKRFILDGLESKDLKPLISKIFSFDEVQEATKYLESNVQIGKIVLKV